MIRLIPAFCAVLLASPAAAEVKSMSATHFETESKAIVPATPQEAYAMIGQPAQWWSPAHSYSGDATALTMQLEPSGCFCETLSSGGFVEHGRVILAMPGEMLRVDTALGPLQAEAVTGRLTWSFKPVAGGTEITQNYVVSGQVRNSAAALAPAVDKVLAEQFDRLKARLSR
ncbi:SRPBCC family protein [Allosphingosinicella vermicomposti]|uniref:SRPBCC family protein n=1 Tax=Allosphingosinicella vermicomposti TaxID=614671 RepID=UPI000D0FB7FE|nr:SRPBCC family protein [Allosphingosinicella vermicomposti]